MSEGVIEGDPGLRTLMEEAFDEILALCAILVPNSSIKFQWVFTSHPSNLVLFFVIKGQRATGKSVDYTA